MHTNDHEVLNQVHLQSAEYYILLLLLLYRYYTTYHRCVVTIGDRAFSIASART